MKWSSEGRRVKHRIQWDSYRFCRGQAIHAGDVIVYHVADYSHPCHKQVTGESQQSKMGVVPLVVMADGTKEEREFWLTLPCVWIMLLLTWFVLLHGVDCGLTLVVVFVI